jgi:hypothetical protein
MKNVLFIISHFGSGSHDLVKVMNRNPIITIETSHGAYYHPDDMNWMFAKKHKWPTASAIYGDHLLLNANFACKSLLTCCKFIYVVRSAKSALNNMREYSQENAASYYCFRLTRICELARCTPGAVLLTWDDLTSGTGFSLIEEYLDLNTQLEPTLEEFTEEDIENVPLEYVQRGQDAYERYLFYLKQLDLKSNL